MTVALVIDNDVDSDRKTVIALDRKADGANKELAQWILNHPRYSERVIAGWLKCDKSRVHWLRHWAAKNFEGSPFDKKNKPDRRVSHLAGAARHQRPLMTNENFQDDAITPSEDVEDPAKVLENVLDSIQQSKAVAEAYRKILKVSPFDREAKKQISNEIELLIRKWRSVQSTLTPAKADTKG